MSLISDAILPVSRKCHPCGWALAVIPDGLVENTFQVPLGKSRALEVLVSLDILGALQRLVIRYRLHSLLSETLQCLGVFSQIELSANKYDGDVGRVVVDLWEPLFHLSASCPLFSGPARLRRQADGELTNLGPDVVKGWRANNGEADEEDVCLRVGERAQSIIVFLSGGIPQSQADWLSINHHTCRVVVETVPNALSDILPLVLLVNAGELELDVEM